MKYLINTSDNIAVKTTNSALTYTMLLQKILGLSNQLDKSGDFKAMLFMENREEWIISLYAAWKKNGIVVPVDYLSSLDDLIYILKDCLPEILFTSNEQLTKVKEAIAEAGIDTTVINVDELQIPAGGEAESLPFPDPPQTALILYTSGTTGNPKGVMLSYENIYTNLKAVCEDVPIYTHEERVMILLPLHHIFPLVGTILAPLYVGGKVAISPTIHTEDIMRTLQENQISIMIGVPRLYSLMAKGLKGKIKQSKAASVMLKLATSLNSRKFSRVLFNTVHQKFGGGMKYMISGGAQLDVDDAKFFRYLGFEILEGYGLTETAPMISFTRPDKVRPGLPGQLLPGIKVDFVEDEIIVSGPNVMKGYYKRPEETAEVIRDEWLYTGDLGYLDKKGYLHITGRKKEIIVLPNGKNINPAHLEESLLEASPAIDEVAVFFADNLLQALIYPDFKTLSSLDVDSAEEYFKWKVIDKFNQKVTPYKKISKFHLINQELPKTRLGKIKRFELPALVNKKEVSKRVDEPDFEVYKILKNFLNEELDADIHPDDHLELDLAMDSLNKVSLSAFIATAFGVEVPEESLPGFASVSKLAQYLEENKVTMGSEKMNWSKILQEKVHLKLPSTWITFSLFKNISSMLLRLFLRVRSRGVEHLPGSPCILAPNHQSFLDSFLVVSLLKKKFMKNTYFYAKEKHFKNRLLRFIAHRNNIIIMDINNNLKGSIQKMAEALRRGKNLMIFPEGTRTGTGKLGKFKQTFAILSRELNVPVVPVAIKGAYEVLPAGARFPRLFKKVQVEFLQPVYPDHGDYESLRNDVYQKLANAMGQHDENG